MQTVVGFDVVEVDAARAMYQISRPCECRIILFAIILEMYHFPTSIIARAKWQTYMPVHADSFQINKRRNN